MRPQSLHTASCEGEWLSSAREPADYCSRDGATALKDKIEAYWRERGHSVSIQLHNVGFHPAIRAARYDVRSDMVNGLPRGRRGKESREGFAGEPGLGDIE